MDRSKWEYKKLGDICDKGSSNIAQNKIEDNTGDYALYGASGYVKGIDFYHQEQPYIGVVKDGSGVGRVNKYPAKSSLLGTMQYIFPKECCDLGYLLYVLQGLHLEKYKTGAAIPHIYFKDYCKCEVPFPSIADQQRIVAELDCLNEMIAVKQEQLKEFDKLAQSIFYDMFGDPSCNNKGWNVALFGNCFKLSSGDGLSAHNIIEGKYPVYGGNGIVGYHNEFNLEGDVIIIGRVGALCGNVRYVRGRIFVTDNAFILTKLKEFNNTYLKNLLEILNLRKYAREAMQPVISNKTLKDITIPLPPLALQQQFADKISAIEAQKELVKQSIAETQLLLDYTMDKYFG